MFALFVIVNVLLLSRSPSSHPSAVPHSLRCGLSFCRFSLPSSITFGVAFAIGGIVVVVVIRWLNKRQTVNNLFLHQQNGKLNLMWAVFDLFIFISFNFHINGQIFGLCCSSLHRLKSIFGDLGMVWNWHFSLEGKKKLSSNSICIWL